MDQDLQYAGTRTPDPNSDRAALPWAVSLLVLTGLAVFICARIEVLNAAAGWYLPRDYTNDPGTWRTGGGGPRDTLCWAVTTLGLLQYPLLTVLLIGLPSACWRIRARRARLAIGIALGLVLVCGALMIYRGYYTSLGF